MGDLHAIYIPEDDTDLEDLCEGCDANDGEDFSDHGLWLCEDCLEDEAAEDRADRDLQRAENGWPDA